MQNTAAALAPASIPMMSGLASGLRARLWKMAPEIPNPAPTSTAVRARGRRSVRTMNSASSVPTPRTAGMTSRNGIGKSPTLIDTQNATKIATVRPTVTTVVRATAWRCTMVDAWPGAGCDPGPAMVRGVVVSHSSESRRRRTRPMKMGAPMIAVMIPTWTSPGRATTRPVMSAPSSSIGAITIEYGRIQR